MTKSVHLSVLPNEITQWICEIRPAVVIDGTFGGGGHSRRLLDALDQANHSPTAGTHAAVEWPGLRIVALDRDPAVFEREQGQLDSRIELFLGSYEQSGRALNGCDLEQADGMILDLGLSSDQLEDRGRGFSFQHDGPLDLRFDPENGDSAADWLSKHTETEIADAIYQFGEERFSRRVARMIVESAKQGRPVRTVEDLVHICRRCIPRSKNHDIHPATRTFQALRIVVNDELGGLQRTLKSAPDWIRVGGRMAIISFHSLEDRIVKQAFRDDPRWQPLTKKPVLPSSSETATNTRSRSAKLRVAERVNSVG